QADWDNTRLVKTDAAGEVSRLKGEPGKDVFIFGSGNLASSLTRARLIDQYRLMVAPVVLGKGIPLFRDITNQISLTLLDTKTFRNGNVLIYYQPDQEGKAGS
ncbi:MAG: dihydrofolate reductase family protein, partial [Anaerolineaceae bacterium]|nr:dihydrofolate reductase family protein [Anaerolineaceae bacterium]